MSHLFLVYCIVATSYCCNSLCSEVCTKGTTEICVLRLASVLNFLESCKAKELNDLVHSSLIACVGHYRLRIG